MTIFKNILSLPDPNNNCIYQIYTLRMKKKMQKKRNIEKVEKQ